MKKPRLLVLTFLCFFSLALPFSHSPASNPSERSSLRQPQLHLSGRTANEYLAETKDGQSLMQALMAARFALQWQERAPGDSKTGDGYLAKSHEQDLNAWFAEDGLTIRPTLPEEKRAQAWSMALRLKSYGYGKELVDVPPVVSRQVKGTRIEYERKSEAGRQRSHPQFTEWYVNRPEGIEQGFTLSEPPEKGGGVAATEPLRLSMAVSGDLRAEVKRDGQEIELSNQHGKGTLSYSKLIVQDADGKELVARMETNADGREIALVVEDAGARYPIVIDPVMASLEKKLGDGYAKAESRFGFAVAIEGDTAVVGAWREDSDSGKIYILTRSGSTWSSSANIWGAGAGGQCGTSVAISGGMVVFGCPGANSSAGRAYLLDPDSSDLPRTLTPAGGSVMAGDRFGSSVAISGTKIVVGAPLSDNQSKTDAGRVHIFTFASNFGLYSASYVDDLQPGQSGLFGNSVAIDGDTFIGGTPGVTPGRVAVYNATSLFFTHYLYANDGAADDQFGQSVAISGNTVVSGAHFNDNAGAPNAGAAYVFVRNAVGNWSQQQKLTASDPANEGRGNNYFSSSAVAIQGHTIVVGAYAFTPFSLSGGTEFGKAYVFMRDGTLWTEQTTLVGDNQPSNHFGIGVDINGNTVIAGARAATTSGVPRAGAAYVYRLDCVPPQGSFAEFADGKTTNTVCPGSSVGFGRGYIFFGSVPSTIQWRKNGVPIPGATDLSINNVSASDAGSYDFVASNSCGSDTSNAVVLSVHSFALDPISQNFGVSGSPGIVNVTASSNACGWTAVSNASFINVTSGSSGTGNGTVGFTVAGNPDSGQRTGTITIAGRTFTVSQDGTNCSYSITPTSQTLGPSASTNTVNVVAGAGCAWTATSNDPSLLSINSGGSGSGNGTVTYSIAANTAASPRSGTLTIAGQIFTVTQGAVGLVANVSTRLSVGTGDDVLIEGFIVQGPAGSTKKIMVRAIGPSLLPFGVADSLGNPVLEIRDASNTVVATNDDWRNTEVGGIITGNQFGEIDGSGLAPSNDLESAIIADLAPGSYTAVVRGVDNTVGTGVVDAYDMSASSPARLANIATRGLIQPGDKLMIAGFIIQNGDVRLVVRAIGPSLSAFGVSNALSDTTLELRDQNGTVVRANDDWETDQKQALENSGLQPSDPKEAAVLATISPGQYTVQVRGKPEATGIGVVQVYFLE